MKALIIGGTGNISESVARMAVESGFELFLLNRGTTPNYVRGAHVLRANINSIDEVNRVLRGQTFDVVANFIAYTIEDVKRDIEIFKDKTHQYIFISSATVYAKDNTLTPLRESSPKMNHGWDYARDKITCERILYEAWEKGDFPVTIVRPSHTYAKLIPVSIGKGMDLIARIRRGDPVIVHDSGKSLWTLTHSDDFARGFVGLMGNPATIGEAFHITSDEHLTWDQIVQMIGAAAGVPEPKLVHIPGEFIQQLEPDWGPTITCDKAFCGIFDNSKIKQFVPGFSCTIPFYTGIRNTIERLDRGELPQDTDPEAEKKIDRILAAWQAAMQAGIDAYQAD